MLTRRETQCLEHTPRNNHGVEEQTRLKAPELEPNKLCSYSQEILRTYSDCSGACSYHTINTG